MKAWVQTDDRGREYLERSGTGIISAVAPVGVVDPDGRHSFHRVEIECDPPAGRSRAIRYSAHPVLPAGELLERACACQLDGTRVAWSIQWHRHEWIPAGIPIAGLNLTTDARCVLVALGPALLPVTEASEIELAARLLDPS